MRPTPPPARRRGRGRVARPACGDRTSISMSSSIRARVADGAGAAGVRSTMRARAFRAGRAVARGDARSDDGASTPISSTIPKATTVTTQVREVLAHRRGVCQDFAHLMISCLRSLGLPARYVSGYILNRVPPGEAAPGRRRCFARVGGGALSRRTAGSHSIRPTANWRISNSSRSAGGANFPTSRRCAAWCSAPPRRRSRSRSKSSRFEAARDDAGAMRQV